MSYIKKSSVVLWSGAFSFAVGLLIVGSLGVYIAHAQAIAPTTPTGLTVTFSPPSSISLSWNAPATSTDISGYYIYRNGVDVGSSGGTSYADTVPLEQSSYTYIYTVAAYGPSGGAFLQSAPATILVPVDSTPPTAPTNLAVTGVTSSSVSISWNASTDNFGVAGYYIIKDGTRVPMSTVLTGTTYTDSFLTANSAQTYEVVAYDTAQNVSAPSNTVTATTFPSFFTVSPPFGLTATAVGVSEIDLAWGGSTVASGTPAYNIYRNGQPIASTTATSYADTGLAAGTSYGYDVTAFDQNGNFSGPSNNVGTSTFPAPASTGSASAAAVNPSATYTPPIGPVTILGPQGPTVVSSVPATPSSITSAPLLTTTLYLGLRGTAVTTLQTMLIAQGDLGASYATGYFGALTQKAVQQFQCAKNIICSGSPWTTGWGSVGPKTRAALNAL